MPQNIQQSPEQNLQDCSLVSFSNKIYDNARSVDESETAQLQTRLQSCHTRHYTTSDTPAVLSHQTLHSFRHACSPVTPDTAQLQTRCCPVTPDTAQLQTRLQSCHSRHCTTSDTSVVLSHQTRHNFRHVCCPVTPDTAQLQTRLHSCHSRHRTNSDTFVVLSHQTLHNFRHACSPVTPDTAQLQSCLSSCHTRHYTTSDMCVVVSDQTLHNFRHVCCRVRPDITQLQTRLQSCQIQTLNRILIIKKKINLVSSEHRKRKTRGKESKQHEEKGPPQIDPVTPFYSNFYSNPRVAAVVPLVAG